MDETQDWQSCARCMGAQHPNAIDDDVVRLAEIVGHNADREPRGHQRAGKDCLAEFRAAHELNMPVVGENRPDARCHEAHARPRQFGPAAHIGLTPAASSFATMHFRYTASRLSAACEMVACRSTQER